MRAVVCDAFGPVSDLRVGELPEPLPGPGEVVVAVEIAGVNYPDTLIVQGMYQARPELPFAPGFEGVGTVISVGDGVSVPVGTRVIGTGIHGSFAEQWLVDANQLIPIPDRLGSEVAAAFGITYGTMLYALVQRAALQAGETVLVLGAAGGIGSASIDLSNALGARVIAAVGSDDKVDYVESIGAEAVVNYDRDDLKDAVKELTGGRGVDVIVDPVGGHYSEAAARTAAWNGRLLVIGFTSGEIPSVPTNLALLKGMSIVGVFWGAWAMRDPAAAAANFEQLLSMIDEGAVSPHIHGVYPLEDFAGALDVITSRRATGKVLLRVAG